MDVDISGRHFHVTEGLHQHALDKIKKLDRYALKLESAHVIFQVQKIRQVCEIVLSGKNLRMTASEGTSDMYASFDAAVRHLEKQLARYHEKVKSHRKKGIREVSAEKE